MKQAIVSYYKDDHGDWVAVLTCGHGQHVRHKPPWQNRPWVRTEKGRNSRVGKELNCKLCDEVAESPQVRISTRRHRT